MKYKHRSIAIAALVCTGLLVSIGAAATASTAPRSAGGLDQPTQTIGSASFYGTSAPLPKGPAAASPRAPSRDTGTARTFAHHPAASRSARPA